MKSIYILAALLLVSSVASEASAHERIHRMGHHAHYRTYGPVWGGPWDGSSYRDSQNSILVTPRDDGPNGPSGVSAGGTMWNGRSASEFGG
jgi:hypothetical protein